MRYFTTPPEFWWEESITISSGGKEYTFLSPEKNVLYTSFRLFSKGFVHFRFLVLIAEVIRHYRDNIDWDKLFGYAKEYKFENVLRVVLKLSAELLGAPVTEEYAKLKNMRSSVLCQRAAQKLFREEVVHSLDKALFAFLHDDLSVPFKVLLHRFFPPMGEIVSRYRLVPGSAISNPMILLKARLPRFACNDRKKTFSTGC